MTFFRRGRAPGAVLLMAVLGMLVAAVPAAPVTIPHPAPVPMKPGTPGAFTLRWGNDRRVQARMLRETVNPGGARVTVGSMLDAANRQAHTGNNTHCRHRATGSGGALHGVHVAGFYCLRHDDATDPDWSPQGVSGTEDARSGAGTVDRHKAIVFSWHAGPPGGSGTGTRLSFLDTATKRYIHVLLVVPNAFGTDYSEVSVHAGGIAWYRNYLFVTANQGGLHVYDTRNLLRLAHNPKASVSRHCPTGRQEPGGSYCGRGYDYLLPEIGRWNNPNSATTRYDSMALERAPGRAPEFLTSEYRTSGVGQVARWTDTELTGFHGTIHPYRAWFQPVRYVQGAFSRGCYYFNTGGGGSGNRDLVVANATGNHRTPVSRTGGRGLQDLYWLRSAEQLWTLTEHPGDGKRVLYGVSRPACP
ncbi:hypothetical protein [Streptomyces sp. NK08204]|uniref:hypothetical protein n=1 Tax=Streptomyces sp. NK08204 TaxID=2873260 RepID=UPI001CECDA93|nr:hypothetical protein [Streptomyces sp. NK08204]